MKGNSYSIINNGLKVKTKDGKEIKGLDFNVEIKEHDASTRSFIAVGSSSNPDRSKDVVNQDGWKLKNYQKAPRGLWMHRYYDLPVFKSLKTWVDKDTKRLLFKPSFDSHDFADKVYNQFLKGFLSDFSVGFIPLKYDLRNQDDYWGGFDFQEQELLEISAVTVPDNPEAQMLGLANNDAANLINLGYKQEFDFDETKGIYWNPVSKNLEAYGEPRIISIGNGIKAVNAVPLFENDKDKNQVIGYYFDSSLHNEEFIKSWIKENVPKSKNKIYQVEMSFDEDKPIELDVVEEENKEDPVEEKNVEEEVDKTITKCVITYLNKDGVELESCEFEYNDDGKLKFVNNVVGKEIGFLTQNILDRFEGGLTKILNDFTVDLESKSLKSPSEEKNEDESDLIEFDVEGFPPVTENEKSIEDDLIEFEIEEGELKQMAKNVAIDIINNNNESFEELFNQVLTQIED